MMGWGAIVLAVLIALNQSLSWAGNLNYLWALLTLIWGIMALSKK